MSFVAAPIVLPSLPRLGMGWRRQPDLDRTGARGRPVLRVNTVAAACLLLLGACARQPGTDQELVSRAQEAVDQKLGAQAQFSLMEASVEQHIACGHATANGTGQDFVYRNDRLILDTNVDFDHAAIQCDEAIGGGNIQVGDDS